MVDTPSSVASRLAALSHADAVREVGLLPEVTLVELLRLLPPDPAHRESTLVRKEIVDRHIEEMKGAVARVARGIISQDLYEDVIYGVFFRFFEDSSGFKLYRARKKTDGGRQDLGSFLCRKARWRTGDLLRKEKRTPGHAWFESEMESIPAPAPPEADTHDPDSADRQALYREFWKFRDTLSTANRAVFDAYFVEKHTTRNSDRLPTKIVKKLKEICGASDASTIRKRKQALQAEFRTFLNRPTKDHG